MDQAALMEYASRTVLAALYTGANGQELLDICQAITQYSGNTWSIDPSTSADVLMLRETSPSGLSAEWPVAAGQVMVVAPDFGIIARTSEAGYRARYRALDRIITDAVAANLTAIAASDPVQAAIRSEARAQAAKAMYGGFGVTALPLLLAGATSSPLSVPLQPAQPDTGYEVGAFAVSGAAVLSAVTVTSVTKAPGSVSLVVKNTGLISLSGLVLVHVTAPIPAVAVGGQAGSGGTK